MELVYFFIIILIIIAIIAIIYINYYNQIQYKITKIEKAEFSIDEILRERYSLVIRANDVIQKKLKEKKNYLKEYTNLKTDTLSTFDVDQKLKDAFSIILHLTNDNKVLNKDDSMQEIIIELKITEERLSAAKAYYNRNTEEYNEVIRKVPSNIISNIHNFKVKAFFDRKDMQDEDELDFKL